MRISRATTLIEVLVALAIFILIMTTVMSGFYIIYSGWRKQKEYVDLSGRAKWAIQSISSELICAENPVVSGAGARVDFNNTTGGTHYWYWRGDDIGNGSLSVIYRGQGATITLANATRQELVSPVINNPSGNALFTAPSADITRIELTVGRGTQNYTIATTVRSRN
jgi:type II secretory pathway pseudopilin PulG